MSWEVPGGRNSSVGARLWLLRRCRRISSESAGSTGLPCPALRRFDALDSSCHSDGHHLSARELSSSSGGLRQKARRCQRSSPRANARAQTMYPTAAPSPLTKPHMEPITPSSSATHSECGGDQRKQTPAATIRLPTREPTIDRTLSRKASGPSTVSRPRNPASKARSHSKCRAVPAAALLGHWPSRHDTSPAAFLPCHPSNGKFKHGVFTSR
ncbi:unnamed protein product [Prorocentrum cordatum]|nr:unnamed protein product [Polarella glacialis]